MPKINLKAGNQAIFDHAVQSGDLKTIKRLIKPKVFFKPLIKRVVIEYQSFDLTKKPRLDKAIQNGHLKIVKFLLEYGSKMSKDESLLIASEYGQIDIVKYLIENAGANIDHEDPETGYTPIFEATYGNHLDVVKYLVENGSKLTGIIFNSIIVGASKNGYIKILDYLAKNGVDMESKNNDGDTRLHSAVKENHKIESVKCLIENGADLEAKDEYDRTPLYCAVEEGHFEIVKCLV